ncbi:MAG: hypothetical protein AAB378_00665 [Patescibacteria group bacterium]
MEIVKLTQEKYKEWDAFCLESDDAWFWHTSKWLEYTLNFQVNNQSESRSFFLLKDGKMAAICPLILENNNGAMEFSYNHYYGPVPALANHLTRNERKAVLKEIFKYIDCLAKQNNVKRVMLRGAVLNPSLVEAREQPFNFLMQFGFIDASLNTQILDLRRSVDELRRGVRHGHDSDIDKASKILTAAVFDCSNITREVFDKYTDLHHKDPGRAKRKSITFDMMYDWIKDGDAFLIGAQKENKFIGFSYFFIFKNNVYYGSACNDSKAGNLPIAHFIQWEAIQWMCKQGIKFYEIGWQYYSDTLQNFPSDKEKYISQFKRGFGGISIPLFMGEKYYDKDYFLGTYDSRIKKYGDNLERVENE